MNSTKQVLMIMALTGAAALAGCFGSDDSPAPEPMPVVDPLAAVPEAATQSVAGALDYLEVLGRNPSDTREALDVSAVVLPTSDTDEPRAVD